MVVDDEMMGEREEVLGQDDKNLAVISHLITFAGFVFPFGNILGPLAVYLAKKDHSSYVRHHAAEALNFQITITILFIISAVLALILIGFLLLLVLVAVDLVFTIIAAIKASEGVPYRYPLNIRFIG